MQPRAAINVIQATLNHLKYHKSIFSKALPAFVLLMLFTMFASAHTINYDLEKAPLGNVILYYLKLGIRHIVPDGLDHILFITGLCLLSNKIKPIIWQATAFTVAHCITLFLSMKNIIVAPPAIVEPIIALTILFVALENILFNELKPWRIAVVFIFGLIHGMGFASALNEIGLPRNNFISSLLSFNVGVEIGQHIIIFLVYGLFLIPFGKKPWYRTMVVIPVSIAIACVALFWAIQRF